MLRRLPLLLLALGWLSASAAPLSLKTAAQEDSSPKFVQQAGGKIEGICIDVLRALEAVDPELHISGQQQALPLARLERLLESGRLDLACGLIGNQRRARQLHLLEPALYVADYGMATRRGDPAQPASWEALAALGGDNVVLAISGSGINERIRSLPGIRVDASGLNARNNLAKLAYGRGRFFYYRLNGLREEIRSAGLGEQLQILPTVFDRYRFHLALGRHLPPSTVERIQTALLKLQAKGSLLRISTHWQP